MTGTLIRPEETAASTGTTHRRRWPWIVAVVVLLITGAVFVVARSRGGAKEASFDQANQQFQHDAGTTPGPPALLVPGAGVYRYTGSGTEKISLLATEQHWGAELPVTITHGDPGCWTFRVDYSSNHWQDTTYCENNGVLQEHRGQTYQMFDFVAFKIADTTEFTCAPPADRLRTTAAPGDQWTTSCTGHSPARNTNVTSSGVNTFVDREDVAVGTENVPALHYRYEGTLAGDQKGTEKTDVWFAADTAQLLRTHRDVNVTSPSPIGDVVYTELGDYQLADRSPTS